MKVRSNRWQLVAENVHREARALDFNPQSARGGISLLRLGLILVVALFLSRAFFLQVVVGRNNQVLAEGNRIEVKLISADRAVIQDRQGLVLARNGLDRDGKLVREYPYGEIAAHVLGYVGAPSAEDLQACADACRFAPNELIGKMGIEKALDQTLRGQKGESLVETNAAGSVLRTLAQKPAIAGNQVKLNLDIELTRLISQTLAAREQEKITRGAVIVAKANTNEVLAFVSWPGFDPNLFSGLPGTGRYRNVSQILADTDALPLFNRAAGGVYPPGSTYKLVTATAGLETGQIDSVTQIEDTGEIKVGEFRFGTWNFDQRGQKEGFIGLTRAIARSNDIFFYKVGEMVGVEQLRAWSEKLGLGKVTGIELGGEAAGTVPDPVVKERDTGQRWFLGNTYHMAIGQGDLLTTPLQINRMTAAVVSDRLCPASLVAGDPGAGCREIGISQEHRELILTGMKQACASGGTAFPFFDFQPQVACKTGTAQHGGEKTEPHAWITVIVPGEGQTELEQFEAGWVITVLLEEAGEGSYEAGPVARAIAEYLVSRGQ